MEKLRRTVDPRSQYEAALEYGYKAEKLALESGDKRSAGVVYNHMARNLLWNQANLKSQLYVVKTDANGNEEWSRILGDANLWNEADWIGETPCGNYIVVGRTGVAYYGTDTKQHHRWQQHPGLL